VGEKKMKIEQISTGDINCFVGKMKMKTVGRSLFSKVV